MAEEIEREASPPRKIRVKSMAGVLWKRACRIVDFSDI
jgi:hypothetical protein